MELIKLKLNLKAFLPCFGLLFLVNNVANAGISTPSTEQVEIVTMDSSCVTLEKTKDKKRVRVSQKFAERYLGREYRPGIKYSLILDTIEKKYPMKCTQ